MYRFCFLAKITLLLCFCFSYLNAEEENILFSKKNKKPIYAKVKYDKYGNRRSVSFIRIDEESEHLIEMDGLAISKLKFDEKSKTFKVKEYDIDKSLLFSNKVKFSKDGFELITFLGKKKGKGVFKKILYDNNAEKIQEEYLDENNKPTSNKQNIHKIKYKYNPLGKKILVEYFDTKNKLKEDSSGIAKYMYTYDARGNRLTSNFFGANEKLKENKDGIASESFTYDYTTSEKGKLILEETFDKKGYPKADAKGIAKYIYNYDKKGNRIFTEYRDVNGKLTEDGKGFAKYIFEYSESGIVILEEEYGKDGNLKLDPADGIARSTTEIQTQGDTTFKTTKFFGTNGELKINEVLEVAIVKTTTKQSAEGKEIKTEYFDTEGKPKFSGELYASMIQKYDSLGNQILEEYFDTENKPATCRDGYSKYTANFKNKEMLSEEYLTKDGKLIEGDDGFAKQIRMFNSEGKLVSIENFNSENKYIESNLGYAKMINSYNADGYKSEEIYLNSKLEPINNSEGFHKIEYQYNKNCLTKTKKEEDCYSLIQYFDSNLNPKNNKKQISKTVYIYDDSGRIKSIENFSSTNQKHSRRLYSYEFGNKKETTWETYKNDTVFRGVYYVYIFNPYPNAKPIVKITLNKLSRPISIKLIK
ncbi:MAG: hypothetical protein IPL26_29470 [Leptospiraceae bacterium]|nr:hypothetical protein [Leptospiraceae bacterium]